MTDITVCMHCGEKENFFLVQGINFCGLCGKKCLVQGTPAVGNGTTPKKKLRSPKKSSPKETPSKEMSTREKLTALKQQSSTPTKAAKVRHRLSLTGKLETSSPGRTQQAPGVHAQESAIIMMEVDELRAQNDKLEQDNVQLKATLDELMATFNDSIEDHKRTRIDQVATIGILEMEVSQMREDFTTAKASNAKAQRELAEMQGKFGGMEKDLVETRATLKKTQAELTHSSKNFELLKTHAGQKLKQAAMEYKNVAKADHHKDSVIQKRMGEVSKLKDQLLAAQKELESSKQAQETMQRKMDAMTSETENEAADKAVIIAQLADAQLKNADLTSKNDDLNAVTQSLKGNIVQMRTQVRDAETKAASSAQSDEDLLTLQLALDGKDQANKELVTICDELLAEVDTLKKKLGI